MKRTPLARKTPLRARQGAAKPRTPLKRGRTKGKASTARQRARKAARWKLHFLSPEFVRFTKARPCVKCGRVPSEVHHEPPRSRGGTWEQSSSLCRDCHTSGAGARHRVGPTTFWTFGITAAEANAAHREAWENKGLAPDDQRV